MTKSITVLICYILVLMCSAHVLGLDLYVAADNKAWIFKNGKHIADTRDWRYTEKLTGFHVGDIIEIKARDTGYIFGVIAAVGRCVTKVGAGPWKVVGPHPIPSRSNVVVGHPGSSKQFPYSTGAEYVWEQGKGEHATVKIALKITEECLPW